MSAAAGGASPGPHTTRIVVVTASSFPPNRRCSSTLEVIPKDIGRRPISASPTCVVTRLGLLLIGARESAALREQWEHNVIQPRSVAVGLIDCRAPNVAVWRHP